MIDFEYELQVSNSYGPELESIFVMSSPEYGHISSSIVRRNLGYGADVSFLIQRTSLKLKLYNCGN